MVKVYTIEFLSEFRNRRECKSRPKKLPRIPGVTTELDKFKSNNKLKSPSKSSKNGKNSKTNNRINRTKSNSKFIPKPLYNIDGERVDKYGKRIKSKVIKESTKYSQTKSLLNKLTIEKYATISQRIARVIKNITKDENDKIINLIFEKAVMEINYTEMYTRLCKYLSMNIKPTLIYNFNYYVKFPQEDNKFTGICQLIGEQWNYNLIDNDDVVKTFNCIIYNIQNIINDKYDNPQVVKDNIEFLVRGCCQYLFTINKKKAIDEENIIVKNIIIRTCNFLKHIKNTYYNNSDTDAYKMNSRTMFNIMNILDLFNNNWIPVHNIHIKNTPGTLHKDNSQMVSNGKDSKNPYNPQMVSKERVCSPWKQKLIEKQRREEEERKREEIKILVKDQKISKNVLCEYINSLNHDNIEDIEYYINNDIKNIFNFVKTLIDLLLEESDKNSDILIHLLQLLIDKDIIDKNDVQRYIKEDIENILDDLRIDIPKVDSRINSINLLIN